MRELRHREKRNQPDRNRIERESATEELRMFVPRSVVPHRLLHEGQHPHDAEESERAASQETVCERIMRRGEKVARESIDCPPCPGAPAWWLLTAPSAGRTSDCITLGCALDHFAEAVA